ncbi:TonB-dependent receptor [Hephaestia sp. GCM10023244]|uniref:TonB-dependent receptor n=1 Tax=unclassified Hephaestia TaxID=2631281 RepID=UPI002076FF08|nr:TonB-dependent receptor [Hephaestia sp. MAHUQ-44]MCM8732107.1 TonB-dependent receptor [Hephaestia sp. MAHUQ-44]
MFCNIYKWGDGVAMKRIMFISALVGVMLPVNSVAQDTGSQEVIVTAKRSEGIDYSAAMPVVGLRRSADFAVQEVTITGDTRDGSLRQDEIYKTLANAIAAAPHAGVQIASGDETLQIVTLENYRNLSLKKDSRPDSQKLSFLVKAPLGAGNDARSAQAKIASFVKVVKPVGRALMETSDDLTFSVVAPDQYRGAITDIIAADAKSMAAKLGDEYGVEIEGLNRPVEWARSGLSEVLLYIPYKLVIVPKH